MESTPPSYLQATTRDHWSIISSFVRSQDLCSAALVCRAWNWTFTPQLWGNPASHFGTENDAVYVALVRFKRTLGWARECTRELTHTLRLPPARAELYDGPRAEWLRDLLARLPRLQSLIVSGLPFFDHWALLSLRVQPGAGFQGLRTYNLKLLEAENCFNATSAGIAEGLALFTSLVYLDLSGTYPARHPRVLETLKLLPCLQILKLRGLGLRDEDVSIICQAVGLRVRSLDVRDNRITDLGVRYILQNCITTTSQAAKIVQQTMSRSRGISQGMHEFFGVDLPAVYKFSYQDQYVYNLFTTGFFRPGIEDALGSGITHLFISGNPVSPSAISDLLHIQRLHVLDVGSLVHRQHESSPISPTDSDGIESLVPLFEKNGQNLTYLRLPYRIVTAKAAPITQDVAELDGGTITTPSIQIQQPEAFELEGDSVKRQELPAEAIFELEGSGVDQEPAQHVETRLGDDLYTSPLQRSISEEAPEPLFSPLSPIGHEEMFHQIRLSTVQSAASSDHSDNSLSTPRAEPKNRARSYSGIIADHEARLNFRKSRPHGLLPSMLPSLRTLALTDVPTRAWTRDVPDSIVAFIAACGEESHWSRLQSRSTYALPPGSSRSRASVQATYATSLFALRQVVLEVTAVRAAPGNGQQLVPRGARAELKSSVEDPDCEVFWSAAAEDFSFFGSGGAEECGVPESELRGVVPLEAQMGKMVVGESVGGGATWTTGPLASGGGGGKQGEVVDVLAEISRFRREKRAAHQNAVEHGLEDQFIEGFWEGDIKVIRR